VTILLKKTIDEAAHCKDPAIDRVKTDGISSVTLNHVPSRRRFRSLQQCVTRHGQLAVLADNGHLGRMARLSDSPERSDAIGEREERKKVNGTKRRHRSISGWHVWSWTLDPPRRRLCRGRSS